MTKRKRLPYSEGDWFGVPLSGGEWAVGLLARMAPEGAVLLGYFFGPSHPALPELRRLKSYQPQNAILVTFFLDPGLCDGEWPVIGKAAGWNRSVWPVPDFGRDDPLREDVFWRVRYPEDLNINESYDVRITKAQYDRLPQEGVAGHVYVQAVLSKVLRGDDDTADTSLPTTGTDALLSDDESSILVSHYLYFTSADVARRVGDRIRQEGHQVTVDESASGSDWLVLVHQMLPAVDDGLDLVVEELEAIAEAEGGEYDGYERGTRRYPTIPT